MIKAERTTKTKLDAKGLILQDGNIVDIETGEAIVLTDLLERVFGTEDAFDISVTKSVKDEVDTEGEPEEVDIDDIDEPLDFE